MQYPMYTAALSAVLAMTAVRSHEELLVDRLIVHFTRALGKAMFVSHQWGSYRHADPDGRQFRVLQDALSNLLAGTARVSPDLLTEMIYGRAPSFSKANLTSADIYIWYDFFSIPQITIQLHTESQGFLKRSQAIASIPAYIEKCEFFVALCPVLTHADTAQPMDQYSWAKRGWCRVEKAVRNLLAPNDMMLMIESPKHMSMLALRDTLFHPFGAGEFTIEGDRQVVGQILRDILELKLHNDLWKGNLLEYRFFMNRQDMLFQNCNLRYIPSPLRISSTLESLDDACHEFLHQNGFLNVTDRDRWGFSPLCYAVTKGSPELVKAMLAKKANPNDRILKANKKFTSPKNVSVLSLCVLHKSHEVLELLLTARAHPSQRDGNGNTPVIYSAFSNDGAGAKLLCDFKADPRLPNMFGFNCMDLAFSQGASDVATAMWSYASGQCLLHWAMLLNGGDPDFVSMVVEKGSELNYLNSQFHAASLEHKLLFGLFRMKYRLGSRSVMSRASYHHSGATPLMLSIITGKFCAARILLRAGARVDLRNARNWSAFDFAIEMQAPDALFRELIRCGADKYARLSSIPSIPSISDKIAVEVDSVDEEIVSVQF